MFVGRLPEMGELLTSLTAVTMVLLIKECCDSSVYVLYFSGVQFDK